MHVNVRLLACTDTVRVCNTTMYVHIYVCAVCRSPLGSVEYAAGSLSPELRRAGGEEDEQLLHHGADVGG